VELTAWLVLTALLLQQQQQLSWLLKSKNLRGQIFLTGDKFKYAPEKRLNGQSEVFYYTANENSRDHYKLRTDKGGEYAEK